MMMHGLLLLLSCEFMMLFGVSLDQRCYWCLYMTMMIVLMMNCRLLLRLDMLVFVFVGNVGNDNGLVVVFVFYDSGCDSIYC